MESGEDRTYAVLTPIYKVTNVRNPVAVTKEVALLAKSLFELKKRTYSHLTLVC